MKSNLVLTSPLTLNLQQPTSSPLPSKFATPLCSWGRSIKIKLLRTLIANSLAGSAEAAAATFKVETIEFAEF